MGGDSSEEEFQFEDSPTKTTHRKDREISDDAAKSTPDEYDDDNHSKSHSSPKKKKKKKKRRDLQHDSENMDYHAIENDDPSHSKTKQKERRRSITVSEGEQSPNELSYEDGHGRQSSSLKRIKKKKLHDNHEDDNAHSGSDDEKADTEHRDTSSSLKKKKKKRHHDERIDLGDGDTTEEQLESPSSPKKKKKKISYSHGDGEHAAKDADSGGGEWGSGIPRKKKKKTGDDDEHESTTGHGNDATECGSPQSSKKKKKKKIHSHDMDDATHNYGDASSGQLDSPSSSRKKKKKKHHKKHRIHFLDETSHDEDGRVREAVDITPKKKKKRKKHSHDRYDSPRLDDSLGDGDHSTSIAVEKNDAKYTDDGNEIAKKKKKKSKHSHGSIDGFDPGNEEHSNEGVAEMEVSQKVDDKPIEPDEMPLESDLQNELAPPDSSSPQMADSSHTLEKGVDRAEDDDDDGAEEPGEQKLENEETCHLESGPKFHVNQRVLCVDTDRSGNETVDVNIDNDTEQSNEGSHKIGLPPLFEAIVRQSGLRQVDPTTGKVLPETKFGSAKKRGRRRLNFHDDMNEPPTIDNGPDEAGENQVKQWCHLIHFKGWNSRHDKWMAESEIFPDCEPHRKRVTAPVAKVARVLKAVPENKEDGRKKKKKSGQQEGDDEGDGDGEVNDGVDPTVHKNFERITKACTLPFTLQTILVDEKDRITKKVFPPPILALTDKISEEARADATSRQGITMLHRLPSKVSIKEVMGKFIQIRKQESIQEFVKKLEKEQKKQAQEEDKVKIDGNQKEGSEREELQPKTEESTGANDGTEKVEEGNAAIGNDGPSDEVNTTNNQLEKIEPNPNQQRPPSSKSNTKAILKTKNKKRKVFARSILALVDTSLPLFLLYEQERQQFLTLMSKDRDVRCDDQNATEGGELGEKQDDSHEGVSKQKEDSVGQSGQGQQQSSTVLSDAKEPCEIYGAEFLLRLFTRLPLLIAKFDTLEKAADSETSSADVVPLESSTPEESSNTVATSILSSDEKSRELAEFLSELKIFLQRRRDECFQCRYVAAD